LHYRSLESLFGFGTDKNTIKEIISTLKAQKKHYWRPVEGIDITLKEMKIPILVPEYTSGTNPSLYVLPKYRMTKRELELLRNYVQWIGDDRILLFSFVADTGYGPREYQRFREMLSNDKYFLFDDTNENGKFSPEFTVLGLLRHVASHLEDVRGLREIRDTDIVHFRKITVDLPDEKYEELITKIEKVKNYPSRETLERELGKKYGKVSQDEYNKLLQQLEAYKQKETFQDKDKRELDIYYVAEHYYNPIMTTKEKLDWIRHIIKTESEDKFLEDLVSYLSKPDNLFKQFDWWMFSKIDESVDEIYIPYYNSYRNTNSKFKPDFIFWLVKGKSYSILFVDPKGVEYSEYQSKVDGYERLFVKDGEEKTFNEHGFDIRVFLSLYTEDRALIAEKYRPYWYDNINSCLQKVLDSMAQTSKKRIIQS
jgi:type III restriction enzyme